MEVIMTTKEDLIAFATEAVNIALNKLGNNEPLVKERPEESSKVIRGIRGLAEFLGVSQPTAQKFKNEKLFPYMQHGRTLLFKSDEVLAGLERNKARKNK